MDLVYKHEKPLFIVSLIISIVFWIVLTLSTLGTVFIYFLVAYLFFLFAHSAFIAQLKGSAVRISEQQFPDLHQMIEQACEKVGMEEIPEAYMFRSGSFNALATRFLGRNYLVLYTDVLDALHEQTSALDFYIGHELGHIHRKHLKWNAFLLPSSVLPIIGSGLRRAQEYSCDRYGANCCQSQGDIQAAIAAMAAGDTRWRNMDLDAYTAQIESSSGFWMSFHELNNDYPWLSKRMASAMAFSNGENIRHPARHKLACLISCFVPRFASNGILSIMVTVMLIGVLVAVALPAYQEYSKRTQYSAAYTVALRVTEQVDEYIQSSEYWPETMLDLGYGSEELSDIAGNYTIGVFEDGIIGAQVGVDNDGEERYIVLEPEWDDGHVTWECYGQNVLSKYLPQECR
ncbi:hypothetical protein DBZ36_01230 [Alginatibacterium sediminis]|uniref:Peptidase M48 domain-containing protein n=1 Tax=Alginatibacterium sediminis TaxID=2164068 RepID=A0A420ENP3_9ALTE|nr:M48 family metalloprotease [Alginatibacterium sediminis]RKF22298.1 hypothetical protein DBZ36_01230 [Alginatibacterium sediminis]